MKTSGASQEERSGSGTNTFDQITILGANAATAPEHESLYDTVAALDTAVFDAFNHCSEPGQLDKHASYFAADVEFYHDKGGVTWTREDMIADVRKNVCGKFRRELVAQPV